MSELDHALAERFLEYQYLRNAGAARSALVRLGEIYHCLPKLAGADRRKWTDSLANEFVPDELVQSALVELREDMENIRRIVSIGTNWTGEEILLVLTLRIEIELALSFLSDRYAKSVLLWTEDVDREIEQLAGRKETKPAFYSAAHLIKKNWGLPIESHWIRQWL